MIALVMALAESDCEQLRTGWLAQPANAVSSLAYLAVAAWLLWRAGRADGHRIPLVGGGVALAAVGVGSFSYHGPQPGWAGAAHDGSIVMLVVALVGAAAGRLTRAGGRRTALAAGMPAATWMALAVPAHLLGRSGSALCHPAALWQPHAVWHVMSAVALGFVVLGLSGRDAPSAAACPAQRPSGSRSEPSGRTRPAPCRSRARRP